MFTFVNFIFILIAGTNLLGILLRKAPSVREIATQLVGVDGGVERLRTALILAGLAQVWLVGLIFPLKAIDARLGLAWSVLMLISVLETIYTGRKMYAAAAGPDKDVAFPFHDSVWYKVYQILYNLSTIGVCVFLMIPRE